MGRGGKWPPKRHGVDLGEIIMPDEGEEGNTAYTGKLGKKGQVKMQKSFSQSQSPPRIIFTIPLPKCIYWQLHSSYASRN